MNYLVLDLETASADCASICQIGIVEVVEGLISGTADHLIDPGCDFHPWNVRIHGIDAERVAGRPLFPEAFAAIAPRLEGRIVVTHGPFDRTAIARACRRHGMAPPDALWLDNQTVVRRTWTQFARKGYALGNLARHFGIAFRHHDALEDALATAEVFRLACRETGLTAAEWHASIAAQAAQAGPRPRRQAAAERRGTGSTASSQPDSPRPRNPLRSPHTPARSAKPCCRTSPPETSKP